MTKGFNMRKILVTGGLGLIGKHLIKQLLAAGDCSVFIVDDESTSIMDRYNEKNLANSAVTFYQGTVDNFFYSHNATFDEIYHLAAPVGPVGVLKHTGTIATEILKDLSQVTSIALEADAKLMFISTSEVYGQNPVFDQPEDIDKIVPPIYTVRLEYGVAKLLGEIVLSNIARKHPIRHFVVRPFNITGPGQNSELGFVLPRFIKQALSGEPITVYGDGSSKRTFTHVDDFASGIVKIMASDFYGGIFNVGNPNNVITIGEMAREIKRLCYSNSEIIFIDPTTLHGKDFAEAWNKIACIDKMKSMLGWTPVIPLETVLVDCIEYERNILSK